MAGDDLPGWPGGGQDDNPFAGMPMFADLARALSGQGPLNWEAARQFATMAATGGASEPNVDPAVRLAYEHLLPIAEMHVRDATGLDTPPARIELTSPGTWAQRTLEAYRPLFIELAQSLGGPPQAAAAGSDPLMSMFAGLSQMMAPAMLGMSLGSMVGRLATRAFGQYDLPIPRSSPSLLVVSGTVDAFAADWALPIDSMRLWVLAQELAGHAVYSQAAARDAITSLVQAHVGAFRPDPEGVMEKLSNLEVGSDDPMQAMQQAFSDPEVLLGAVRSPEQIELAPVLDAATCAVVGFVDYTVDSVAARIIGGDALRISEAVRRRRIEASSEDVFIERLLGLQVTPAMVQRGKEFVQGIVDRAGEVALPPLFTRTGALPTPAEVDAPGLWLARIAL